MENQATINKQIALNLINSGKFVTVEFIKKDGNKRVMNCRAGVKKHLAGGKSTIAHIPELVSVWTNKGYRCFNIDRLLSVKAGGVKYNVWL